MTARRHILTIAMLLAAAAPAAPALIERDWRMRDGIGTEREARSYPQAIEQTLARGDRLVAHLRSRGVELGVLGDEWEGLRGEWERLGRNPGTTEAQWEDLWRRAHVLRRRIVFTDPLAETGPVLFVKRVPSAFSHQLTQYLGRDARPGGGLFVLAEPGRSLRCRQLAAELPTGSYLLPDVSFDGRRVVFAFCAVDQPPRNREDHGDVFYHLYEVRADGSGLRQLTDGPHDDVAPRYLPDGRIVFLSTRRGGFHRCGRGPCPTHTLHACEDDGSNITTLSWHETHEWDPCVLGDGRIVYTRWDYVDRHAVHYQQLWTCRPDGSLAAAYYGNNTLSPVGTWEARPVPGSARVMATAAAHHAMTAGSVILLDTARGIDGPVPITRLTPDALFPESEAPVLRETGGHWHAPAGVPRKPAVPVEQRRWPGHCYRSPWPLSETVFLAAYSYQPLIGEPTANRPEMFGLYLCDAVGNRELLYRDPAISSLWPIPLRPRGRPPAVPTTAEKGRGQAGLFLVLNVYE
ncbi:MAG: TolB family protein, partial [Planctomycetota bacterium]